MQKSLHVERMEIDMQNERVVFSGENEKGKMFRLFEKNHIENPCQFFFLTKQKDLHMYKSCLLVAVTSPPKAKKKKKRGKKNDAMAQVPQYHPEMERGISA